MRGELLACNGMHNSETLRNQRLTNFTRPSTQSNCALHRISPNTAPRNLPRPTIVGGLAFAARLPLRSSNHLDVGFQPREVIGLLITFPKNLTL